MASESAGLFVWYEHLTRDPKAAIGFYGDVVGWGTEPFGNDGYTMWVGSQGPLGGVMQLPEQAAKAGAPPHWVGSVLVEDIDATIARVGTLGGKVLNPPQDIPEAGRYGIIADPQGAFLGVFQPARDMQAHDVSKDGEMCWNELVTSDPAAGFAFYSELFGWKKLDTMDMGEMGTYLIYGVGERQLGGMMAVPKDAPMPPSWGYYVQTSDLDAALARAQKHGVQVVHGPTDVPGGGRIVQFIDPQGAMFALHEGPMA